jgi:hypothetical protein
VRRERIQFWYSLVEVPLVLTGTVMGWAAGHWGMPLAMHLLVLLEHCAGPVVSAWRNDE